jgi:peptidoglycan hydrolase-like protein with peptidoglycan-binding domain
MPRRSLLLVVLGGMLAALLLGPAPTSSAAGSAFATRAQRALNRLGCDAGPADGSIGTHTRAAIVRFQAANHLGQDGHLTDPTRARLYADQQVRCDRRPVPRHSSAGRRIVISQRQNYVWLVRSGGGVAAQGPMVDNPSVLGTGSHRVSSYCGRSAKIRTNTSGSLLLPYFTRFAPCGVGFHQVPLYRSGAQIHPDWMLGTNLKESHGCIRLSRRMAAAVWDFGSVGTPVVVVRG